MFCCADPFASACRDLKPSNVFVCHEPHGINFKIGDFGLSKLIRTTFPDSPQGSAQRVVFEEYDERGGHFVVQPSEAALVDAPLISKDRHFPVREPLTAGVGTASYAAPEQATSKVYGSSADIFSLGLILLELICSFSTEHERLQVFGDCRHKRKVPDEVAQFPLAARTILSCTEPDPAKRPTALELSTLNFRHETTEAPTSRDAQVETLTQQLAAKELEVEHYKLQLQDRQRTIESLERELRRLTNGSPASIFTYPKPLVARAPNTEPCTLEVSSSSSSDEDR
jgi:serine/threonine protein kinase